MTCETPIDLNCVLKSKTTLYLSQKQLSILKTEFSKLGILEARNSLTEITLYAIETFKHF